MLHLRAELGWLKQSSLGLVAVGQGWRQALCSAVHWRSTSGSLVLDRHCRSVQFCTTPSQIARARWSRIFRMVCLPISSLYGTLCFAMISMAAHPLNGFWPRFVCQTISAQYLTIAKFYTEVIKT